MAMVTLLRPTSSPSVWSRISVAKRCRSAQRRYIRSSIWAQSVASVPPAPALMVRIASRSSYGPLNRRAVRSRSKSAASPSASSATSAASSGSASANSSSSARSDPRRSSPPHRANSSRKPSASRMTRRAPRVSSQKPGSMAWASSTLRRAALAGRSKTPRGRPDPFGQLADGTGVHLVAGPQILEQDRPHLDDAQGRLAPGHDGVHAGAVGVVGTDAAVTVTVEVGGIAAPATVALTGDEVDELVVEGTGFHDPSLPYPGAYGAGGR